MTRKRPAWLQYLERRLDDPSLPPMHVLEREERLVEAEGGRTRIRVGLDERSKSLAALAGFFAGVDVELEGQRVPRYRSFREAYIDLTGDERCPSPRSSQPARRCSSRPIMSTNEQLGLVPAHLWVPIELEQTAYELTRSSQKPGTADNDANYVGSLGITPHSVPYFTDANNWFLTADKADLPIIEVGFIGSEEPELYTQDNPNLGSMFDNDTLKFKLKHVYGATVLDHRGAFGAVVA